MKQHTSKEQAKNLAGEQWREPLEPELKGMILVSNLGRAKRIKNDSIIPSRINNHGFSEIVIYSHNKSKKHLLHLLTAGAWIPNPEQKKRVNHIDGNKQNNKASNLRYVTHSEAAKIRFMKKQPIAEDIAGERWREPLEPELKGMIQVSNLGRVKFTATNTLVSTYKMITGYREIQIRNLEAGKPKSRYLVHRLTAGAWIPNPEGKAEVNHLDRNKQNNKASNLEWTTHKENLEHYLRTSKGLAKSLAGERWREPLEPELKGIIQVSNLGRVKNIIYNTLINANGKARGYNFFTYGKRSYFVHRLTAGAWNPNPDNKLEVFHLDHNKQNNKASNLVWLTRKERYQMQKQATG